MRPGYDQPPTFFKENGKDVGIVKDVLDELCKITGDNIQYVEMPFPRSDLMFDQGKIDIEPALNPVWRPDSLVQGIYTIPYGKSVDVLLFRNKESYFPVNHPTDLSGKMVGVVQGYRYQDFDEFFDSGLITKIKAHNEKKLLEILREGRVDSIIIHKPLAQYLMKREAKYQDFVMGNYESRVDLMIRLHPNKKLAISRFNEAIRKLLELGIIENIYDKYR
jgi:polar amino acid transport system substrate-binding protein